MTPQPASEICPAVVLGLADLGEPFRLVANVIEVVPPAEPLPRLPVARAVWRPLPDLPTSAEAWLNAGGPPTTRCSRRRWAWQSCRIWPRCSASRAILATVRAHGQPESVGAPAHGGNAAVTRFA
jgi:hypothetical protein